MERNIQKNGVVNLIALFLVGVAGFAVARFAGSLAGQVGMLFLGIGVLVAAVSWFQMRLEEREQLEKLELDELSKTKGGSTLFANAEADVFPAQRSRQQFERYFVPGFTAVLFIVEAVCAFLLWRWLSRDNTFVVYPQPLVVLALFGLFALILFLLGKFAATVARLEDHRLLRPGASWLLLSAYMLFLVALAAGGVKVGVPKADFILALGLCGLLGLVALETLVNLILEIYRPRVKGRVTRPLYESRLVGLLGRPEGIITTAAQALDYQFGFKVSETGFFRLGRELLPLFVLCLMATLTASTAVVFIEPGEQGLLEHFGKPAQRALDPGVHLKWPWPIDRVYRYRTEQIQSFNVGFTPDPATEGQSTVLWSVPHTKEENFLVANRDPSATSTNALTGRRAPPISLLTVSIPVQFQITDLNAWAYNNGDPAALLQSLATREVVRYLVSADLEEVMSRQRGSAAEVLRGRIQQSANERRLGARIVFVGLQDIHPPTKVAGDYEKVVSAGHQKQAKILAARAEDIKTNALAGAQATHLINQASAERVMREIGAIAQAALFTNQIPAYRAAPSVYRLRAYLEAYTRATAEARKYLLLTTNMNYSFVVDLQDKIPNDLMNLNVAPKK